MQISAAALSINKKKHVSVSTSQLFMRTTLQRRVNRERRLSSLPQTVWWTCSAQDHICPSTHNVMITSFLLKWALDRKNSSLIEPESNLIYFNRKRRTNWCDVISYKIRPKRSSFGVCLWEFTLTLREFETSCQRELSGKSLFIYFCNNMLSVFFKKKVFSKFWTNFLPVTLIDHSFKVLKTLEEQKHYTSFMEHFYWNVLVGHSPKVF